MADAPVIGELERKHPGSSAGPLRRKTAEPMHWFVRLGIGNQDVLAMASAIPIRRHASVGLEKAGPFFL
ncbi:MAG TPA: hypothetical protein VIT43_09640, partial [Candidatus Dormibacteraeota bacterium]